MATENRIVLTFDEKVREQLKDLKEKTNAKSFAEVVRKGLDLLQKEVGVES